jgi:hypothetical protein
MKFKNTFFVFSKKTFTQTRLLQNNQTLRSFNDNEVALNWSLAKLYINARNNLSVNSLEPNKEIPIQKFQL